MNDQRPLTTREIELLQALADAPDGVDYFGYLGLKMRRFGKALVIGLHNRGLIKVAGSRARCVLNPLGRAILTAATAARGPEGQAQP